MKKGFGGRVWSLSLGEISVKGGLREMVGGCVVIGLCRYNTITHKQITLDVFDAWCNGCLDLVGEGHGDKELVCENPLRSLLLLEVLIALGCFVRFKYMRQYDESSAECHHILFVYDYDP
jgi:hypothetical protein